MRVESVTFSIGRAMPLQPISGRAEDAYASVKPMASCTVELDAGDDVEEAKKLARSTAFTEMLSFSDEFRALYKPKGPQTKDD